MNTCDNPFLQVWPRDNYPIVGTLPWLMSVWQPAGKSLRVKGGSSGANTPVFQVEADGACEQFIRFNVTAKGNVGIGVDQPQYKLHLKDGDFVVSAGTINNFKVEPSGNVFARSVKVNTALIPDYVFEEAYNLLPLTEIEQYINSHRHLPGIPSAKEYNEIGYVDLGDLQLKLLEKVEELTLHLIRLQKENQQLKHEVSAIANQSSK